MATFCKRSHIPASAREVFAWHENPEALKILIPPWEPVTVLQKTGGIRDGDRVILAIRQGPLTLRWVAEHRDYRENESFTDVQIQGPFKKWVHTHRMIPERPDTCLLEDSIEYELPFSWISGPLFGWLVRAKLERMFDYRHRVTREAFAPKDSEKEIPEEER
jgi:ligand-binding SRPBCC domain-containing protein